VLAERKTALLGMQRKLELIMPGESSFSADCADNALK
jgi:hypothetical protein